MLVKIGFNQGCTLHNSTLENDLILCEKHGFDFLELRIDKLQEYETTHTLEELKGVFDSSRIMPHAINGIYLYDGFLMDDDDPKRRDELVSCIKYALDSARKLGSPVIIVVPAMIPESIGKSFNKPWSYIVERSVISFIRLSDLAASYGINVGVEIVGSPRCSVRTIEEAKEILTLVNRDNIGYTLDAYNLYLYNKSNDFSSISLLDPKRIYVTHINGAEKDLSVEKLKQSHRTFCDRGFMDSDNFLANLAAIGYNGMVSIEFFREDCWAMPAEKVIEEAWRTTMSVMKRCGVYV
jgi:2-keto-myo-inositol isomerase